jgi:hypothetical protein
MNQLPRPLTAKNILRMIAIGLMCLLYINLTSCYTKKKAVQKFCKADTVTTFVTIHDTLYTEQIQTDTAFSLRVDSIVITRDKLTIEYRKIGDTVYIKGRCAADTVYLSKTVEVKVPVTIPNVQPTWLDKIRAASNYLLIAFLLGLALGLFVIIKR